LNKNTSFFISAEHRSINNVAVYDTPCDALGNCPGNVNGTVPNPHSRTNVSPRIDLQIGAKNTLTMRYQYYHDSESGDISATQLPTLSNSTLTNDNSIQISDTEVINDRIRERNPLPIRSRHLDDHTCEHRSHDQSCRNRHSLRAAIVANRARSYRPLGVSKSHYYVARQARLQVRTRVSATAATPTCRLRLQWNLHLCDTTDILNSGAKRDPRYNQLSQHRFSSPMPPARRARRQRFRWSGLHSRRLEVQPAPYALWRPALGVAKPCRRPQRLGAALCAWPMHSMAKAASRPRLFSALDMASSTIGWASRIF
jgi:hypothetical protein